MSATAYQRLRTPSPAPQIFIDPWPPGGCLPNASPLRSPKPEMAGLGQFYLGTQLRLHNLWMSWPVFFFTARHGWFHSSFMIRPIDPWFIRPAHRPIDPWFRRPKLQRASSPPSQQPSIPTILPNLFPPLHSLLIVLNGPHRPRRPHRPWPLW